jgi:NAD+ synthetase
MLKLNEERTVERITEWMQKIFRKAGFSRAVLGLSGGIDSAVVACLAVRALGADNVACVKLPYRTSSPASLTDADKMINMLGVKSGIIDISHIVDVFEQSLHAPDPARLGNIMARVRMTHLFRHLRGNILACARNEQQDRALARLRNSSRRPGIDSQSDRRILQKSGMGHGAIS